MPGKNKPKRLDRQRSWRVARRKRKIARLVNGNSRNRKPRPKKKKLLSETTAKTKVEEKKVEKKAAKKVAKKTVKKEE